MRQPRISSKIFQQLVRRNVSYVTNITLEQWRSKDISTCILMDDPECFLEPGKRKDLAIAYFCGQDPACQIVGDLSALAKAQQNVEQFYPVVGVLEDFHNTLAVLEERVPFFFQGVTDLYYNVLNGKLYKTILY